MSSRPNVLDGSWRGTEAIALLVLALSTFLAVAALASAELGGRLLADDHLGAFAIVSLPPPLKAAEMEGNRVGVMTLLLADPIIERVVSIPEAEVRRALGSPAAPDLPMPIMLEIRFAAGSQPDLAKIERMVRVVAANAVVEDAGTPDKSSMEKPARYLRQAGWTAAATFTLLTMLASAGLAWSLVDRNAKTIEVLRALGADPGFIANQLQRRVGRLVLAASLLGGCLAIALIACLSIWRPEGIQADMADLPARTANVVRLGLQALAIMLVSATAAWLTTHWTARRIP